MWNNILSVIKKIDIASFVCEESCRFCGRAALDGRKRSSLVLETSASTLMHAQLKTGPPQATCLCITCSELMYSSRQSIWSLPIPGLRAEADGVERDGDLAKWKDGHRPSYKDVVPADDDDICGANNNYDGGIHSGGNDSRSTEAGKRWNHDGQPRHGASRSNQDGVLELRQGTAFGTTCLLTVATAGMYEGPMQKLIRRLKYDDDKLVVADIGPLMNRAYEMLLTAMPNLLDEKDNILLVPVPLHPGRQRKRGYNQAELIAKEFAKLRNLRVETSALKRKRKTRPQYGLKRQERLTNIKDAFQIGGVDIKNKTIILVDDVFTSGATLTTCAALLTECGAKQVTAMAAARAPYDKRGR
ncbi:MAG: ComF family protein [Candidatus Melainabacteria bacterium]|nr:ComF family protein [Candidatus Melainabacteria bacterium]